MAIYKLETYKVKLEVAEDARANYRLSDSASAAKLARPIFEQYDADKEHFVVFFLNNENRVNGFHLLSIGTLVASLIRPQEVYALALSLANRAAALIFVHNHPSGDPAPSPEDIEVTRLLKQAGEMFQIRVLDHVILGSGTSYYSMSDRGNL